MPYISIQNLSFTYESSAEPVFQDLNLTLSPHWRLGLTGRNGSGKTTLLRLLTGEFPYEGRIETDVAFVRFPCTVTEPGSFSAQVAQALAPEAQLWEIQRELSLLGLPEELLWRPYSTLSPGEQTKVQLSALFLRQDAFPLIDEPTNHLDQEGRHLLADYLKTKPGFLLISHDRSFLDVCCSHMLVLTPRGPQLQRGGFSSWQENRDRQLSFEESQNQKLKKEIRRLNKASQQAGNWSGKAEKAKFAAETVDRGFAGHKAAKMMKRSKQLEARRERMVAEKSALLQDTDQADALSLFPLPFSGLFLQLRDVSLAYGEQPVLSGVNLTLRAGERLALQGGNGSGKTSLLRLCLGELSPTGGELYRESRLKISCVPQRMDDLTGTVPQLARQAGADESLFAALLRKLGFTRPQLAMDARVMSPGQKKKLLLAQSLATPAHLYIWDEPLNYIDIISRMQLEEAILRCRPTLLFVEHDAAFCQNVATSVFPLPPHP